MDKQYWMVEVKSPRFSCPVSFLSEKAAREAADRWKKDGAFRVNIYLMSSERPSGQLLEAL